MERKVSRRSLLHGAAGIAAAGALGVRTGVAQPAMRPRKHPTMVGVPFERHERVRIGVIGTGGRGRGVMWNLLAVDGVEFPAICDINPDALAETQKMLAGAGKPKAEEYGRGDTDYERLVQRDDLDLVLVATPWDWHVPQCVAAMDQGHHCAVEVPAAVTLEECWQLVEASERTRRHCVILENCCYGDNEMLVLNMVREGVFGNLTYGEAAYIHDLRGLLVAPYGEGLWRRKPHTERDGNLYPTHGLGPVAQYMGIGRGDKFDSIVSMSTKEAGLSAFVKANTQPGDSMRNEVYLTGDVNTSLIRTHLGRVILLQHDVISPRPYSRMNMLTGTKATFADYPARMYVDGQPGHDWQDVAPFRQKYEPELWKRVGDLARRLGGHGGMDFIMGYRLIETMKQGAPPDMDVYDAAAWSAPTALSQESVAMGGSPQLFPDFTRGEWNRRTLADLP